MGTLPAGRVRCPAMDVRLDGKVALVTGGSRGIGKAIAAQFVASGARVMIAARKADGLRAAADEIGGDIATRVANAGDPEAARDTIAETIERFGSLDILVNNAATNPFYGPTLDVDLARYDKTMEVNLRGTVAWTQEAWRQSFSHAPGKVVINLSSVGGLHYERGLGVYNLTKAALMQLTNQLAHELAPNCRVMCIAPGLVKTSFSQVLIERAPTLPARLPARRLGEPADIAALATFLASEYASWITGQTYVIDGGASAAGDIE